MLEIVYLAESLDPVKSSPGPLVVPSRRYEKIGDSEQFDILLIPGGEQHLCGLRFDRADVTLHVGPVARPENVPRSLLEFVQRQVLGATHILTVCTGSWVLAGTGLLRGEKATTNKASFNMVVVSPSLHHTWLSWKRM